MKLHLYIFIVIALVLGLFINRGRTDPKIDETCCFDTVKTFTVPTTPDETIKLIFNDKHLKAYSKGVHKLTVSNSLPTSHTATYEYRYLTFKNVITFRRSMDPDACTINIKMLSCRDNIPFTELEEMSACYRVIKNTHDKTVVTYSTFYRFKKSVTPLTRLILKNRIGRFITGLEEYLIMIGQSSHDKREII